MSDSGKILQINILAFFIYSWWYGQQPDSRVEHAAHARPRGRQAGGGGQHAGPRGAPRAVPAAEPLALRALTRHARAQPYG